MMHNICTDPVGESYQKSRDDAWEPNKEYQDGDLIQTPEGPRAIGFKHDDGKVQAGVLLDFRNARMEVAKVGTFGAEKYERDSWRRVENGCQRYTDALWRHLRPGKRPWITWRIWPGISWRFWNSSWRRQMKDDIEYLIVAGLCGLTVFAVMYFF